MLHRFRASLILIFLFFLCNSNVSYSQSSRILSSDNSISSNLLNAICQDKYGFIWIATEDGLNRLEDNKVIKYFHIAGDSLSLNNNYVRSLYEDSQGRFWIGCMTGIQLYDRDYDCFHNIPIYIGTKLVYPHITSIIETKQKDIWIGTSGLGVIVIPKGSSIDTLRINHDLYSKLHSVFVTEIYEDDNNNIWVASTDKLMRYTPSTGKVVECLDNSGHKIPDARDIISDNKGNLIIGTLVNGLYIFNEKSNQNNSDNVIHAKACSDFKIQSIRCLQYDESKEYILIGTDGNGLYEYNINTEKIFRPALLNFTYDNKRAKIHKILRDKDGNIWISIYQKGLLFLPHTSYAFKYYGYKSLSNNIIGSYCVTSLYMSKRNTLWVGTDSDGLYQVNLDKNTSNHFFSTTDEKSVPHTILNISGDKKDNLILCSYFNGVALFNKQNNKVNYNVGLPDDIKKTNAAVCDSRGNIWVGTLGDGLYGLDAKTHKVIAHKHSEYKDGYGNKKVLTNDWINSLAIDNTGLIWIGTNQGFCCYDPISNTFPHNFEGTALQDACVNCLLVTKDYMIIIAALDGCYEYNPATRRLKKISKDWDMKNNQICALAEGNDGNIWFSTHEGLYSFSRSKKILTHYSKEDGLQGNEFYRNSVTKASDGRLFFGGMYGITAFYPREIIPLKHKVRLFITSLTVNERNVKKGVLSGKKEIIDTTLLVAKHINLNHNDNNIVIKFSSINYLNADKSKLRYRLLPKSDKWVNTSFGNRTLAFSELKPGDYRLDVQLEEKAESSDINSINIHIRPAWYETKFAIILWILLACVIIGVVISYLYARIKFKKNELSQEHQRQLQEAKIQYFTDISHEIRTPMTLILSPLNELLKTSSEYKSIYRTMYRNGQTILKLVNQLLDVRKIEKEQMNLEFSEVDIVQYIKELMDSFDYNAKSKDIELNFIHEEPHILLWVDIHQFDKIIINILSNAFKYTPEGGHILLSLSIIKDSDVDECDKISFPDGLVKIEIIDDGPGIPDEMLECVFERFYQVDKSVSGTGIGLHLADKLVQLHHGDIKANNVTTGGACFTIRIPKGSHFIAIDQKTQEEEPVYSDEDMNVFIDTPKDEGSFSMDKKRKKLIYVAEDNDDIKNYLEKELKSIYEMKGFGDGKELYEAIKVKHPDLVVSDVMMPNMDGETLCRKIKDNNDTSDIPVILLTARVLDEEKISGLESGADSYIVKPFNMGVLKVTIRNLILSRKRLTNKVVTEELIESSIKQPDIKGPDEALMERVMKEINLRLADPSLTVEQLATEVGLSRVHLHRKIKQLTNMTPSELIRNIRLKKAAELLKKKDVTVSDAAYATGFVNITHFSTSFKEQFGVVPSKYSNL